MKKYFILFITLLIYSGIVAQSVDEKQIANAVEELRKAMIDPTQESLDKVIFYELSYGHSSGKMDDKASFISSLVEKRSDFVSITTSDQTIKIINKTAVVRHKLIGELVDSGKTSTVSLGVLLVWIKDKHQWKLLARQAFKL